MDPAAYRPKWRWMNDPNLSHQITFFVSEGATANGRLRQSTVIASDQAESKEMNDTDQILVIVHYYRRQLQHRRR